jgi:RIO-like serine/threonine protein kinase
MVVMGYVDGKQLFHKYPQATPAKVLEEVSEALKTLHENGLVFGDLRSPNILVTDQPSRSACGFRLVWKGGRREYPEDINLVDIKWPKGVVPGGLLQFEHDNEMFKRLSRRD